MGKQELAMQVLQQVVKLPMVKVDREKFLVDKFSKELDRKDIATLLEKGPTSSVLCFFIKVGPRTRLYLWI